MKKLVAVMLTSLVLLGCNNQADDQMQKGVQRERIQGFETAFYRVSDGKQQWYEIAISVDESRTFHMPVFFSNDGNLVKISPDEAKALFDKWLKGRAKNIASYGSIDPQTGLKGPFLAIDVKQR